MPTVFVALVLAVFALTSSLSISPAAATHALTPAPESSAPIQHHHVRGGVVQINPATNATRFIPFRLAREFDRRQPAARAT